MGDKYLQQSSIGKEIGMNEWLQAIATVGFPIVCCIAMFTIIFKTLKELTDAINDLRNAIIRLEERKQ